MNYTMLSPVQCAEDTALLRTWADGFHAGPAQLPIAFKYDGKEIHGIPADWQLTTRQRRLDANMFETVYEGRDVATGLTVRVELLEYLDFPVTEWTAWFTNTGDAPTPLLSDIQAMELAIPGIAPVLQHCNGDFSAEGYTVTDSPLPAGETLTFAPDGGRPCDRAFPYYRVQFADYGCTLAIGWPGQWSATFAGGEDGIIVHAGQQLTHLRLLQGETIRTPRMTLMSWAGDSSRGINLWRRWYAAHVLPKPDGHPVPPLLAVATTDFGQEFLGATEENQLRFQEQFAQVGLDYDVWWIDAGWYPVNENRRKSGSWTDQMHWWPVGTWTPDPARFPRGFRVIADNAKLHGARFLLWFEPERVHESSQIAREHAEWLLQWEGDSALLNLGNPACRQWLTEYLCAFIQDNGVDIYRQDFNFAPLPYWRSNDAEDRQGMLENLYVQGYLQFWDDLLARNPGLLIDSCASGGRRNDLETMRRSVPLHHTDQCYGEHAVKLDFHRTLFQWIPYFKEFTFSWDIPDHQFSTNHEEAAADDNPLHTDSFSFHCALAGAMMPIIDIRKINFDVPLCQRMIAIWRQAAPFIIHGDFYAHTPAGRANDQWVAWQFDRPESGEGIIQGIRLADCPQDVLTVYPCRLDPAERYRLSNPETGAQQEILGATLLKEGLTLHLPPRSGALWFYRRIRPDELPVASDQP